jgi:pimeloyl-ACP methyl ester carboxylesterase
LPSVRSEPYRTHPRQLQGRHRDRVHGRRQLHVASHLSSEFTVFTYDRRGRGESGDRAPYGVEREIEDLQAVIDAAGGSACVYGISSGGALALEAANRLSSIDRLALYELPYVVDDTRPPIPANWAGELAEMAATDQRADPVRYFMRDCVGLPRFGQTHVVKPGRLAPVLDFFKA